MNEYQEYLDRLYEYLSRFVSAGVISAEEANEIISRAESYVSTGKDLQQAPLYVDLYALPAIGSPDYVRAMTGQPYTAARPPASYGANAMTTTSQPASVMDNRGVPTADPREWYVARATDYLNSQYYQSQEIRQQIEAQKQAINSQVSSGQLAYEDGTAQVAELDQQIKQLMSYETWRDQKGAVLQLAYSGAPIEQLPYFNEIQGVSGPESSRFLEQTGAAWAKGVNTAARNGYYQQGADYARYTAGLGQVQSANDAYLLGEMAADRANMPAIPSYQSVYEPILQGMSPAMRQYYQNQMGGLVNSFNATDPKARQKWWEGQNLRTSEEIQRGQKEEGLRDRISQLEREILGPSGFEGDMGLSPNYGAQTSERDRLYSELESSSMEGQPRQKKEDPFATFIKDYPFLGNYLSMSPQQRGNYSAQRLTPKTRQLNY